MNTGFQIRYKKTYGFVLLLISPSSGLMQYLSLSFSSPFTSLKWDPSVACQNKLIFKIFHILYLQSGHWNIDAKGMKHKMKFTSSCKSKVSCRHLLDIHMNPHHLPPIPLLLPPAGICPSASLDQHMSHVIEPQKKLSVR